MKKCFIAAVVSLALFTACGDDESSTIANANGGTELSSGEQPATSATSSETEDPTSAGTPESTTSADPESSNSTEPASSNGTEPASSNSAEPTSSNGTEPASSSAEPSSSNGTEPVSSSAVQSSSGDAPASSSTVNPASSGTELPASSSAVNPVSSTGNGTFVEVTEVVHAGHRSGPAVAPRVIRASNGDATVTIRDEGADLPSMDLPAVQAELSNDTIYATLLYPDSVDQRGFMMGVLTFTVSSEPFAGAKYLKIGEYGNVKPIYDVEKIEDDTVSTQQDLLVETNEEGYLLGKCLNNNEGAGNMARSFAKSNGKEQIAKMYVGANGELQVLLEAVDDYCGIVAKISQKRSGDTLAIDYYDITDMTRCTCLSDHWFDIDSENYDIKYVKFKDVLYTVKLQIFDGVGF